MALFKISEGPWRKMFEGSFQEQSVEIYINPESVLLVVIYEEEDGKRIGAVIEMYKVLASIGELEEFVATLPREVLVLTKHTKEETVKFFLLGSAPSYVQYEEEAFQDEAEQMLKKLKTSTKMIQDVSKAYDLTLEELQKSEDRIKEAFFTQPLLVPLVSTASHPAAAGAIAIRAAAPTGEGGAAPAEAAGILRGEIFLGLTKEGNKVVEPLSLFLRAAVFGKDGKQRKHALHLVIEGGLFSNVPVVVFDWGNDFAGLPEGNKDAKGLEKYKVGAEPIGLPVKQFRYLDDVIVDLNFASIDGLLEMFGAGKEGTQEIIKKAAAAGGTTAIEELAKRIAGMDAGETANAYQIRKAIRILRLIDLRYPKLFDGSNAIPEIAKSWLRGIGRASRIDMSGADERAALLVCHSIIKGICEFYKKQGRTKTIRAFIVLPEAARIVSIKGQNPLAREVAGCMVEMAAYGVGFAVSSEREIDLNSELAKYVEARLNVVSGNDVGVQLRDRKAYRVFLRPGLSSCSELKE